MNKDEIFLTIFLYCLVVLISSSRPFWDQIGSLGWVRTLAAEMQKPIFPQTEPSLVTPIVVIHANGRYTEPLAQSNHGTQLVASASSSQDEKQALNVPISYKEEIGASSQMPIVHRAAVVRKGFYKPRKELALPLNGITTVNKASAKEEISKS
jgi:hypothetical protein